MIENFSYKNIDNGVILKLNLKGETLFYEKDYSNGAVKKFLSNNNEIVLWKTEDKVIELYQKDFNITGLPTLDMKYVIAIVTPREEEYPRGQAYIYDENGNMIEEILYPQLISDLAKQKRPKWLSFDRVSWEKIGAKYYLTITIRYNLIWYEERIYDFEKREFLECVSSGRL